MLRKWVLVLLIGALGLAGCATIPPGPSVMVLPSTGKSFEEFQAEDQICRHWAAQQTGIAPSDAANKNLFTSAALGTLLGAGLGAAIGAASGNPGIGSAIGAGSGRTSPCFVSLTIWSSSLGICRDRWRSVRSSRRLDSSKLTLTNGAFAASRTCCSAAVFPDPLGPTTTTSRW